MRCGRQASPSSGQPSSTVGRRLTGSDIARTASRLLQPVPALGLPIDHRCLIGSHPKSCWPRPSSIAKGPSPHETTSHLDLAHSRQLPECPCAHRPRLVSAGQTETARRLRWPWTNFDLPRNVREVSAERCTSSISTWSSTRRRRTTSKINSRSSQNRSATAEDLFGAQHSEAGRRQRAPPDRRSRCPVGPRDPFNRLMWDNGPRHHRDRAQRGHRSVHRAIPASAPRAHGHERDEHSPRIAGLDLLLEVRERVPLTSIGMNTEELGGSGDVPIATSTGWSASTASSSARPATPACHWRSIEAMTIGMPVIALATTELPPVIQNGFNGYVSCDLEELIEPHARADSMNPEEARRLGRNARVAARGTLRSRPLPTGLESRLRSGARRGGRASEVDWARSAAMSRGRIAFLSEHASPIARLGGQDAGGQNVYVDEVSRSLGRLGYEVDVFTRRDSTGPARGRRMVSQMSASCISNAGPPEPLLKDAPLAVDAGILATTCSTSCDVPGHATTSARQLLDVGLGCGGSGGTPGRSRGADLSRHGTDQAAPSTERRHQSGRAHRRGTRRTAPG